LHWNVAPAGAPPLVVVLLAERVVVAVDVVVALAFRLWPTPP
jgi:hypothetical protein